MAPRKKNTEMEQGEDKSLSNKVRKARNKVPAVDLGVEETRGAKNGKDEGISNKGRKARNNISAIKLDVKELSDILKEVAVAFGKIDTVQSSESILKYRSAIKSLLLPRLAFEVADLGFYIDFTIGVTKDAGRQDVEGVVVYGTNRSLCFTKCLYPKPKAEGDTTAHCELCDRIARCDGIEDKPLLRLTVDRHKRITSTDLEEEWRLDDNSLIDLHYRVVDRIWSEALDWANENLLP